VRPQGDFRLALQMDAELNDFAVILSVSQEFSGFFVHIQLYIRVQATYY
jgi:hypothetical protein